METASTSPGGFRRWRRARPFWGGLLLLLAGLELFFSANLTLGDLEVHFGPEGFLSYLLPLLLVLTGVLTWVSPGQRLFYGAVGLLTAVYSLIGLNLGGFGLGMLLGIIGGALVLAWAPARRAPAAPPAGAAGAGPSGSDADIPPAGPSSAGARPAGPSPVGARPAGPSPADVRPADETVPDHAGALIPGFSGGRDDHRSEQARTWPALPDEEPRRSPDAYAGERHDAEVPGSGFPGSDDHDSEVHGSEFHRAGTGAPAPLRPAHQPADATQQFPAQPGYPVQDPPGEEPRPPSHGGRRTFVITLVPLAMTAAVLLAGSHTPARAEPDCPEGLPSRPAAAAKKEAARQSSADPAPTRTVAKRTPPVARPTASASVSVSAAVEPGPGDGNPIVDGWNGLVDGVGDLLGVGGSDQNESDQNGSDQNGSDQGGSDQGEAAPGAGEPAEPGASAPPATPTTAQPTTTTTAPAGPSSPAPGPSGGPEVSGSPTPDASAGSASPSATPSSSDIPCLGPRVHKQGRAGDVPLVSVRPGLMETASLTMYDSTYDGVVDLPTTGGTVKVLKFSMSKAVNKPFQLTNTDGGQTAVKRSSRLTAEGDVRFFTPRFEGKLFGLIPVTFTPESPPPLTLPVLWFTDATIDLTLIQCDTMTVDDLAQTDRR